MLHLSDQSDLLVQYRPLDLSVLVLCLLLQ